MANENWADYADNQNMSNPGWWNVVLQQMPQAQYYSSPTGMQFGAQITSRARYFQKAYQDVYSDYLGNIGTSMRSGEAPMSFMDYMETNDPWTSRYSALPQVARGTTGAYSNPRTRFLYNF